LDDLKDEDQKRAMSALRLGKKSSDAAESLETEDEDEKRAMSMLRLGRNSVARIHDEDMANDDDDVSDELDKRAMGMLRLGRSGKSRVERRKSMSMLRLG
jgi:ribosomal protein L30/L7E